MNFPLFLDSLKILVQGMAGVFVVMAVVAVAIGALNKITTNKDK